MKASQRRSRRTQKPNMDILNAMGLAHKTRPDGSHIWNKEGNGILQKGFHNVQPVRKQQPKV